MVADVLGDDAVRLCGDGNAGLVEGVKLFWAGAVEVSYLVVGTKIGGPKIKLRLPY
jgi:hypothetical protein